MIAPPSKHNFDWGVLFRACEQRLRMRKWEIMRYTVSQLVNALDQSDPDDPHAGNMPLSSTTQLDTMFDWGD